MCIRDRNYGSRTEIAQALRSIAQETKDGKIAVDEIDEQMISDHLETSGQPDPDFMIRTSGEERLSNYLLYQLAYACLLYTSYSNSVNQQQQWDILSSFYTS